MKNQYVGDIGDYGKYALLRALAAKGYKIGINWYLTPDDNRTDGKFTDYLKSETDLMDEELFKNMKSLFLSKHGTVCSGGREIATIENSGLLHNAIFFNEILDYENTSARIEERQRWVKRSLETLGRPDIIFLDPDNGLEVKSVPPSRKNGNKYVTYEETQIYYDKANIALIIYNHRDHSPESDYIKRFAKLYELAGTKSSAIYRLTFRKVSVRDYIFVTKPEHSQAIHEFINEFVRFERRKYFSVGHLSMP